MPRIPCSSILRPQMIKRLQEINLDHLMGPSHLACRTLCDTLHDQLVKRASPRNRHDLTNVRSSLDDLLKRSAVFPVYKPNLPDIPIEALSHNEHPSISLKKVQNMVYESLDEFYRQPANPEEESEHLFELLSSLFQSFMDQLVVDLPRQIKANLFATTIATIDEEWVTELPEHLADIVESDALLTDHIITVCLELFSRLPKLSERDDKVVCSLYNKLSSRPTIISPLLNLAVGKAVIMSSRYKDLATYNSKALFSPLLAPLLLSKLIKEDPELAYQVLQNQLIETNEATFNTHVIRRPLILESLMVLVDELSSTSDIERVMQIFNEHGDSLLEDIDIETALKIRTQWNTSRTKEKPPPRIWSTVSTVNEKGRCSNCGSKLDEETITREDTELLKRTFYSEGIDEKGELGLWKNTTPDEMNRFVLYLSENGPYDLVIDDLNLFHLTKTSRRRRLQAEKLVAAFRDKKTLVLSRHHRKKGVLTSELYRDCDFFLTDNESADDVWMIYAALHSGPQCYVFTADHFSLHQRKLSDAPLVHLFHRWQKLNQLSIFGRDTYVLNLRVKTKFHPSQKAWHISILNKKVDSNFQRYPDASPFLCLPKV